MDNNINNFTDGLTDDLISFQEAKAKIIADRDEIEKELKSLPRTMAAQYKRLYYDGVITGLCWALGDMADAIKKQNKGA